MNDTPKSAKFHIVVRDGSGNGGGGPSTGTVTAIAVACGCVAILILALFLWRLLMRCCRSKKSVPLPPVQELAHHRREQQHAAFPSGLDTLSRPETWVVPPAGTPYSGSSVSLLTGREKNMSIFTDDVATAESSSPSSNDDSKLYPPNPSFYRTSDGPNSHNTLPDNASSSQSSLPSAVSPSLAMPTSENGSQPNLVTPAQSRLASGPRPRSSHSQSRVTSASRGRPLSQISDSPTTYSGFTTRSSSVVRGAPHRPGNSMQIILPAPLATQVSNGTEDMYSHYRHSRSSVFADRWLTPNTSNQNNPEESLDAHRT
jgi:hypothetical protein